MSILTPEPDVTEPGVVEPDVAEPGVAEPRTAEEARVAPFSHRTSCGPVTLEPFDPEPYAVPLRRWLSHPASAAWGMSGVSGDDVRAHAAGIAADPHQNAWLGRVDGEPLFYVETYDPAHVLLTDVHDAEPGDVGMHLLVAPAPPPEQRVPGLTSAIMASVVRFVVERLGARRVVVEPDVENRRIAAKNDEVGFRAVGDVDLPDKRARLSVLTRHDAAAAHLAPGPMGWAHRHLVAKSLSEFSHERLIAPHDEGDGWWSLTVEGAGEPREASRASSGPARSGPPTVVYRFRARVHELEHWVVDEPSVAREIDGAPAELDALDLIAELQGALGLPDELMAVYLEELSSTLASAAAKRLQGGPTAERLTTADFQSIEAAMTEGHPAFVAANGRIGFGLDEFRAYAPETAAPIRLVWLAARRSGTHLALGDGLDERTLLDAELGERTLARFAATLAAKGLDPADHHYLPVHPWQWQHRIAITFSADVGRRDLVLLGEGDDDYQAQQSIRTLANRSHPERAYVKTALAIQNMGFLRGLSPAYMRPTPAINDWVHELVTTDPTLQEARFRILRERASVGYTGDAYHRTPTPSPQRKMIAALWRESPVPLTAPGERLMTMAGLLHRDAAGDLLASALIRASGRRAEDWVRSYLHAYLRPVVHCLRAHELAFMPHGENLILVLEGHVPTAVFMKDIGEEVVLLAPREVPPLVDRIVQPVDDREKALAVFTDVFDGVFRYLAAALDDDGMLPAREFWRLVGECVDRHADEHPSLADALDLRVDRFDHSCLNRLQLRDARQMVDLAAQSSSLIYAGTLANPIAR